MKPDIGRALRDLYKDGKIAKLPALYYAPGSPANTTVATWAAELIQTDVMPFLDRLIAGCIYLPLANAGVRYTFGNAGILKIPVRTHDRNIGRRWTAKAGRQTRQAGEFTMVSLSPTNSRDLHF